MPTPLKNMKVSWDDDIPNIWKNTKCSKPPTSIKISEVWWCWLKNRTELFGGFFSHPLEKKTQLISKSIGHRHDDRWKYSILNTIWKLQRRVIIKSTSPYF